MKQAAFAKLHGVSRKTVTMWKARGWLVFAGDEIDVTASNALLERYRADHGKATPKTVTPPVTQNEGNNLGNDAPVDTAEPVILPGETAEAAASRLFEAAGIDIDGTTMDEARRLKEVYLALLHKLDFEKRSGEVVELALAQTILFDEFRRQRDSWLNWPTKVGPLLAADLDQEADRVTEFLTAHVHKQIESLGGEPQGDFAE